MGTCNISTQNGGGLQAQAIFDDMVLYPSPYMVVTPRGYTNHYYAGSERIASRVGNRCWSITPTDEWEKPSPEEEALQNFWNIGKEEYPFGEKSDYNSPTTNTTPINGYEERVQYDCTPVELPRVDILYSTNMLEAIIDCDFSYQNSAPIYYYHSDHLGSRKHISLKTNCYEAKTDNIAFGYISCDKHVITDSRTGELFRRKSDTGFCVFL